MAVYDGSVDYIYTNSNLAAEEVLAREVTACRMVAFARLEAS